MRHPVFKSEKGIAPAARRHMTATNPAKRFLLFAFAASFAVCAFAGSASGRAEGIRFVAGQKRIVQGNQAMLTIRVSPPIRSARSRCVTKAGRRSPAFRS